MNHELLYKANDWLNDKCVGKWTGVVGMRNGHAAFIAYIFTIVRPDKPNVVFCMDMKSSWEIAKIRRICVSQRR